MRNFFVRSISNSNRCFYSRRNNNYAVVNGLKRFRSLREQFQGSSFSSSPNVGIATSEGIRQQLLDAATTELQRVKRYYESEEFKSNTDATTTGRTNLSVPHHHQNQRVVAAPTILETSSDVQTYLEDIDTVMFDCDGVLYRSPHPTPDVSQAILQLLRPPLEQQQKPKQVLFVTNNGSVSRFQLQQKISSFLSLPNDLLNDDMMISSAYACSQYLRTQQPQPQHIFCIGSEGTCNELIDAGFVVTHGNSETESSMSRDDLAAYDFSTLLPQQQNNDGSTGTRQNVSSPSLQSLENYPKIDAVVIGHDTNFTYRKLCLATVLLQQNPTAVLVATNMDAYDITGIYRRHIPGNGALVKAVEYASHRTAVDVGKPSRTLFDLIQSKVKFDVKRTVFVGDRLDTDIRFGIDHGMKSILVMTGVTNATELRRIHTGTIEEPLPTAIMSHVGLMARS